MAYGSSQATVQMAKETLTINAETRRQQERRTYLSNSGHGAGEPTHPSSTVPLKLRHPCDTAGLMSDQVP